MRPPCRLLGIRDLSIEFGDPARPARAVTEISPYVGAGETVAVVGESGLARAGAMLELVTPEAGCVLFEDVSVDALDRRERRRVRRGSDMRSGIRSPCWIRA